MAVLRPHLALTVTDVERSIPFYEALFGTEPEKRKPGYAKFSVAEPALELHAHAGRARRARRVQPRRHPGGDHRRRARREGAPASRPGSPRSTRWTRPAATRARTRSGCATRTARRGRCSPPTRTSRSTAGGSPSPRPAPAVAAATRSAAATSRSAAPRERRDPAQRSPDAVPALGGRAVVAVRRRPRARTASSGRQMETSERDLIHFVLASLMVAEERITTKFSGLVGAHGSEEEATFLSTQQVDEARHMQFYARFQDEVVAEPAAVAAHVERARGQVLGRVPGDLRRGARRGSRAARRASRGPRREGGVRHALPPDPRGDARADDVQVRHRLPLPRRAAARLRRGLLEDPPRRDAPHRLRRLVPARDGAGASRAGRHDPCDAARAAAARGRIAEAAGRRRCLRTCSASPRTTCAASRSAASRAGCRSSGSRWRRSLPERPGLPRRALAEGLAAFALVFCAAAARPWPTSAHAGPRPAGSAAVFGLVIMGLIYAIGHLSGAHINPAVTIAFTLTRHFPRREALAYIARAVRRRRDRRRCCCWPHGPTSRGTSGRTCLRRPRAPRCSTRSS